MRFDRLRREYDLAFGPPQDERVALVQASFSNTRTIVSP
jgi:hypothetical protein